MRVTFGGGAGSTCVQCLACRKLAAGRRIGAEPDARGRRKQLELTAVRDPVFFFCPSFDFFKYNKFSAQFLLDII